MEAIATSLMASGRTSTTRATAALAGRARGPGEAHEPRDDFDRERRVVGQHRAEQPLCKRQILLLDRDVGAHQRPRAKRRTSRRAARRCSRASSRAPRACAASASSR